MNRETVMDSIKLKERFCRDCCLPVGVYANPYFYERIQIIDRLFCCVESFDIFCSGLEQYEDEGRYFAAYNAVKDKIISYIKSKKSFDQFVCESFKTDTTYKSRNLYSSDNDGKTFISIDMKKANFSAMHHFFPEIFDGCETWEQFASMFTDNKHIVFSKYIRQVILEACDPKKQAECEKYIMNMLLNDILESLPDSKIEVFSLTEDEIILDVEKCSGFCLGQLKDVISSNRNRIGNLVRVEMFDLWKLDKYGGWVKNNYSFNAFPDYGDNIEFKGIKTETFHMAVKEYYDEPITENDLVFCHNGKLAKFLKL